MKKLILCADDYGQNPAISQAIIRLLELKRLSATSCMTNMPNWPSDARELTRFTSYADIGLHFNLTHGTYLSQPARKVLPLSTLILHAYLGKLDADFIEDELNAQLDSFKVGMGRLPDFIDGHQHVHQLPIIRDVLLAVYEKHLRSNHAYIRTTASALFSLNFKKQIIAILGGRKLKHQCDLLNIPRNSSFSGIYNFSPVAKYRFLFRKFLAEIKHQGIVMCHPGENSNDSNDEIAAARAQELVYFISEDFLADCRDNDVEISRF